MRKLFMLAFCLVIVLILGVFTVDTRQNAIVENQLFGSAKVYKSGVYFTPPFISKIVYVYMNQRTTNYEIKNEHYQYTFMTSWRVIDPLKYYNNLDQKAYIISHFESLNTRDIIKSGNVSGIINKNNILASVVSIESMGIEIQSIRLIAYNNIESALPTIQKESIAASNEVQYLESSYYMAQKIKTEADVEASKLYLPLQKNDPRFYDYYRLLEVYKKSAKSKKDVPPLNEIYR